MRWIKRHKCSIVILSSGRSFFDATPVKMLKQLLMYSSRVTLSLNAYMRDLIIGHDMSHTANKGSQKLLEPLRFPNVSR